MRANEKQIPFEPPRAPQVARGPFDFDPDGPTSRAEDGTPPPAQVDPQQMKDAEPWNRARRKIVTPASRVLAAVRNGSCPDEDSGSDHPAGGAAPA